MKRLIALAVFALAACSEPVTSPITRRALANDTCIIPTDGCDRTPVVDSISPTYAPPGQMDWNGHEFAPAMPVFVCVYGSNLEGGTIHFGDQMINASSTGCGALIFTAPVTPSGDYTVSVVTSFGESNAVIFTRE